MSSLGDGEPRAWRCRPSSIAAILPDLVLAGAGSGCDWSAIISVEEDTMGKTGRKRRARKKKAANHGKRPNA